MVSVSRARRWRPLSRQVASHSGAGDEKVWIALYTDKLRFVTIFVTVPSADQRMAVGANAERIVQSANGVAEYSNLGSAGLTF